MQLRVDYRVIEDVMCQGHAGLLVSSKGTVETFAAILNTEGGLLVPSSLLSSCPKVPQALSLFIFILSQPSLTKSGEKFVFLWAYYCVPASSRARHEFQSLHQSDFSFFGLLLAAGHLFHTEQTCLGLWCHLSHDVEYSLRIDSCYRVQLSASAALRSEPAEAGLASSKPTSGGPVPHRAQDTPLRGPF